MDYGFVRVASAIPKVKVADIKYNTEKILDMISKAKDMDVEIICFPELCLTSYTCSDLFHQEKLQKESMEYLLRILDATEDNDMTVIIGMPLYKDNQLFNCAVAMENGNILGVVPKSYLPGYKEFYEERWFAPAKMARSNKIVIDDVEVPFGSIVFKDKENKVNFGIEICEDFWVPVPPSSILAMQGAELIFNLSASNALIGKYEYRKELITQQSARCIAGYVYAASGTGESTSDTVYDGNGIIAENGLVLAENERFSSAESIIVADIDIEKLRNDRMKMTSFMEYENIGEALTAEFVSRETNPVDLKRFIDPYPFVPSNKKTRDKRCEEIFNIQTTALAKRISHTGIPKMVIGVSGGLDSALALLVAEKVCEKTGADKKNIIAVTMPGFGTSERTYENAKKLIESTGADFREISIKDASLKHFDDIGHNPDVHDTTYENVQARERTQMLMDIANKENGLVIGTGDLSEIALGWCTYNGDHMSMYSVNPGIPKTLVKFLVGWIADNTANENEKKVLNDILSTPITPELIPTDNKGHIKQKTEDIIGPYELHDFYLYHMVRYGAGPEKIAFLAEDAFNDKYSSKEIKKWLKVFLKRFFSQQFKRSCMPDGPKVGTINLSPRGDWRMPSDAQVTSWLEKL
jgi:NAD+ synthase (glutamine-hydrolysing)